MGGFRFSRPEDVATNPERGTQAVMASTGHGAAYPSDDWGATYIIDADIGAMTASIRIVYDGDDAGDGQVTHPDMGLRNPDNLDWADNGMIYVQEDRSTRKTTFGKKSGIEASVWELNPATGKLVRIAVIDRSALPPGRRIQTRPTWETGNPRACWTSHGSSPPHPARCCWLETSRPTASAMAPSNNTTSSRADRSCSSQRSVEPCGCRGVPCGRPASDRASVAFCVVAALVFQKGTPCQQRGRRRSTKRTPSRQTVAGSSRRITGERETGAIVFQAKSTRRVEVS